MIKWKTQRDSRQITFPAAARRSRSTLGEEKVRASCSRADSAWFDVIQQILGSSDRDHSTSTLLALQPPRRS